MTRIGILAGGGRLPLMIAESVAARGDGVHIVAIEGEADPDIARFPHTWVNWGQIGRMVAVLRAEAVDAIVIAGGVKRPDLFKIRPDAGFFTSIPAILGLLAGGDDSVLTSVVRFFEGKGLQVRGAHEVAPDLLATVGAMGSVHLSEQAQADAEIGFAVRRALGPLDAGQAVVVADGRVLAIEGAEGTDATLERVAALPGRGELGRPSGVLAKGPKPGQELRVDMPAIGPRTIERAAAGRLEGVVVEAGSVLVLDRQEAVRAADASRCALHGMVAVLPEAPPAGPVDHAPRAAARLIGRLCPNRRGRADIVKGLAATERLAPFATGAACVVARAYILAIETGEGMPALLERVRALRQWGLGRRRRVGVLVRRLDNADDEASVRALLEKVAAQGLAGVAVTGPPAALAAYQDAARLADEHGLFLVSCKAVSGTGATQLPPTGPVILP